MLKFGARASYNELLNAVIIFASNSDTSVNSNFLLFFPKNNGETYRVRVEKGQGFSSVSRQLAKDNIIFKSTPIC